MEKAASNYWENFKSIRALRMKKSLYGEICEILLRKYSLPTQLKHTS